jgi:membrane fusion protein, multidrug efflux system
MNILRMPNKPWPGESDYRLFIIVLVLIAGSALFLVGGCGKTETKPEAVGPASSVPETQPAVHKTIPEGTWVPVKRENLREFVPAIGNFQARQSTQIGSQVSGRVDKVLVEVGDPVKKGQELVRLDPTFFDIEFAQRKAELHGTKVAMTDAELNFNRMKNLWEKPNSKEPPSISRKIYDDARLKLEATTAQYHQAEQGLRYAEQRLKETIVRAPYDAVVSKRMVDPGQPVTATPATFLLEIQEVSRLDLDFSLPQNMLGNIKPKTPFEFEVEGVNNGKGTGTITLIFPAVDEATRSFRCRAYIENPGMKYHPGLLAQIRVLNREVNSSFVIPRKSVVQTATGWEALVARGGQISIQALKVGVVTGDRVEVLSGLAEGDKVLIPAVK